MILDKIDLSTSEFKQRFGISENFLNYLVHNLPRGNIHEIILQTPDDLKDREKLLEEFLSKKFSKLAGRDLKEKEVDKVELATGKFESKPIPGIDPQKKLEVLESKLILQLETTKQLFNSMSIIEIISGRVPTNNGIVLYGPGGTGKTTIMKSFMDLFKELGSYVPTNDENEILKTSEVKDTKYYGAYTDYFGPKFSEAIRRARKSGIPSFVCIDEADIFVKKPDGSSSNHSSDVINFFKAYVGNHKELIICLATNVLEEDLDPIATRKGRIDTVEIPLPDLGIAKRLIELFMNLHNIVLKVPLSSGELEDLAQVVVRNKKPGANIAYVCKNYHNVALDEYQLIKKGYQASEISKFKDCT